ncbi:HlyD family secretion protein [Pseudohoeflea suaedae]|uniref:HlyD family secretion protein n=1 Tax=Pseudohoeflea suaedae TaxID=877384 RepID=A0A4R5PNI3_9HYPH|nr:HlyD family secretion protein [Pseudohoeflea suaedae]TDH38612.1 HlyD family secretion protein [Pseudohoeflea suaedae]
MTIQEKKPTEGAPTEAPADIRADAPTAPEKPKRKRGRRLGLMLLVPALLVGVGGYMWVSGGRYEETENANLLFSKIAIASELSGRVTTSNVTNNKQVRKGDVLFQVDPAPLKIAVEQAKAAIETARLNVTQLRAGYQQALAQQHAAENDVAYSQDNLKRYKTLSNKGVATASSYDDATHAARKAEDALTAAKEAVANAKAALGPALEGDIDEHPSVISAKAAAEKAEYNLEVSTVHAPADGMLYEAADFKPGRFVAAGTSLFTLVETEQPWVEANFKETQLTYMDVDQPAEVSFDAFPDRTFRATVKSIGAGTGAEFSLLPAQNATGNWVKVTQRIPVHLKLDNEDAHFLMRSGLSATVTVDTGHSRHFGDLLESAHAAE